LLLPALSMAPRQSSPLYSLQELSFNFMNPTRRQIFLIVWFISVLASGYLVADVTESIKLGLAASFGLIAISLGVPLMRALTEFSR